MTHIWVRAESRPNEDRVAIMPEGVRALMQRGHQITVEDSPNRVIPASDYAQAGATIAPPGSWTTAPPEAIILGLKELPEDGSPLLHRHIMFGHAYKDQAGGPALLKRFRAGGGALYDLEYLTDEDGRRLAAFGYWAGYVGAAVSLMAWAAQQRGGICGPVSAWTSRAALTEQLRAELDAASGPRPRALVIGAKGRVGSGAVDLLAEMGCGVTAWDIAETSAQDPVPEVLAHPVFINAILARPGSPVFVPAEATTATRALRVIGDVACDPTSPFNPIKVYDAATSWAQPVTRVADEPPLDVVAIDNLPSMLPREASRDFAEQLLPVLEQIDDLDSGAWGRARALFDQHSAAI